MKYLVRALVLAAAVGLVAFSRRRREHARVAAAWAAHTDRIPGEA